MASNIRTEIGVGTPGDCPIARASADTGKTVNHVARSSTTNMEGEVTEEFALDAQASLEHPDVEKVFEADSRSIYRFDRESNRGCVCECIEQYGCPVSNLHARNGMLFVSFYAPDIETVQAIVNDLNNGFNDIHLQQLTRDEEQSDHDFVFVDRNRLTDRQREVLETSYEMGYFDHPKRANAGEVAEALGIAPSTFSEHLAAAQRKVLETLLQS